MVGTRTNPNGVIPALGPGPEETNAEAGEATTTTPGTRQGVFTSSNDSITMAKFTSPEAGSHKPASIIAPEGAGAKDENMADPRRRNKKKQADLERALAEARMEAAAARLHLLEVTARHHAERGSNSSGSETGDGMVEDWLRDSESCRADPPGRLSGKPRITASFPGDVELRVNVGAPVISTEEGQQRPGFVASSTHAADTRCPALSQPTPPASDQAPVNLGPPQQPPCADTTSSTTTQQADGLKELAVAIMQAVKGSHTRYVDLPLFDGAHGDWLTFRAAFRESAVHLSNAENVARLRRCLKGAAMEAVNCLFLGESNAADIMTRLEARFGRPDAIVVSEMERLKLLPRLSDEPRDVCVFASRIANIVATVQSLDRIHYLFSPEMVRLIEDKMTPLIRSRWYDFELSTTSDTPGLVAISKFLDGEAERNSRHARPEPIKDEKPSMIKRPHRTHTARSSEAGGDDCELCNTQGHHPAECTQFKSASVPDRWNLARQHKLCFRCLRRRKWTHKCKRRQCEVQGCPAGELEAYALLDDGSTVTLVTEEVARRVGASGPREPFCIEGVAGARISAHESRRVAFTIRGRDETEEHTVTARTISQLDISAQSITPETIAGCEHLTDLAPKLLYDKGTPCILLGQDNWALLVGTRVRTGSAHQPVASYTPLGWVLHGVRASAYSLRVHHVNHVAARSNGDAKLDDLMKQHFALESLGVEPRRPRGDPEVRALAILEQTTKPLPGGGYETGLLWREDAPHIPNNYEATLKRLEGIERKLRKDPELRRQYIEQMRRMLDLGYAEVAPPTTGDKVWYLAHFAVVNTIKRKVRLVHDAAARTQGVCLNDLLLTGPDLLQSLPGVLMRFRQGLVAVAADIKDMFLRIKVREADRDALRFLWREDPSEAPTHYRMASVIFGATSSPATAIYVKNINADRHAKEFPEAVEPIKRQHYMDDYLDSFNSVSQARKVIAAVDQVHRRGNFELQRWTSNVAGLTPAPAAEAVRLSDAGERILGLIWQPSHDSLGFNLDFGKVKPLLLTGSQTPSKRELLRAAMSLYDPLGLVTPVTIQAKHILQQAWRKNVSWDDELPTELKHAWDGWLDSLRRLSELKIPRQYAGFDNSIELQMHTFVDASEIAYAAAVYWRAVDNQGKVCVTLAAAKGRVASLKVTSVPRLELQAAVLGSRLAHTVAEEHDFPVTRRVYWSDSRTVLSWLRAGARTFKPFVAHRVAEIEDSTELNEWRWVPTDDNVADDATRDVPPQFCAEHRWFHGPRFLYLNEDTWPTEPITPAPSALGEEKVNTAGGAARAIIGEALPDIARFSSWMRLIRATAYVILFLSQIKSRRTIAAVRKRTVRAHDPDGLWRPRLNKETPVRRHRVPAVPSRAYMPVGAETLRAAENLWVRALQQQCFQQDIDDVENGKPIRRDSRLRTFAVCMGEDQILRIKSRINAAADLTPGQRNPALMDGKHPYCRLYIDWVHRENHHASVEHITNELRQRFWILRIRPSVRTALKNCQVCRLRRARASQPPTGDLPEGRLSHHRRPFTYVGVDYFGPLSATVGRQHQKRWVSLFTCLTTRAVHLEIAAALSTDSAILALRRFMARRGCPTELWSDNGSNFKGADAELRRAAVVAMSQEADIRAIRWRFIPPGAPFMGGAWERLVRTIKTALTTVLHERHPHEEVLHTLLLEVENTVNSRPLTHVAVGDRDEPALTPHHFILGGPSRVPLPGAFVETDTVSKAQWRASQRLADLFWARWVREALPLLQHRREPHGRGKPLQVGDLVIVADGSMPRNVWPRGVVERVFPGADGIVRAADVRTVAGVLRRPTKKLMILPVEPTSSLTQLDGEETRRE